MSFVGFGWDKQAFGLFERTRALVLRILLGAFTPLNPTPRHPSKALATQGPLQKKPSTLHGGGGMGVLWRAL